ncbi:BlaI/MecI/CopY family transcriptional regulator [Actinomadura montaniterrae]|uniref:BlaI/MecI/CopY family transcriptional regulator n=1 Tax=Actinomadura montaniterrae TaxID=1803903 RepID=A0A6L3VIU1_9ACTN|nr:BlaI/MecI/CopY family transcriptional regulator [Actinomadura montaniterrae]KAB2370737.1 BlaI/MecI/CopY family transcriptional regulator [Actinomadura montaniterrae]
MPSPAGDRRAKGGLEAEVLAVLKEAGEPLTPRQVGERLARPLAYTTVMTVLARLHEKGQAGRERAGRGYAYTYQRDEAGRRAVQMKRLLGGEDQHADVLAHFVSELSPEDEDVLLRLLGGDPRDHPS